MFSSIDQHGRYAFANQPRIAQWNLARWPRRCCRCSRTVREKSVEVAQEALAAFSPHSRRRISADFGVKSALVFSERDGDTALVNDLLKLMAENAADFTLTFRRLCDAAAIRPRMPGSARCSTSPATFTVGVALALASGRRVRRTRRRS